MSHGFSSLSPTERLKLNQIQSPKDIYNTNQIELAQKVKTRVYLPAMRRKTHFFNQRKKFTATNFPTPLTKTPKMPLNTRPLSSNSSSNSNLSPPSPSKFSRLPKSDFSTNNPDWALGPLNSLAKNTNSNEIGEILTVPQLESIDTQISRKTADIFSLHTPLLNTLNFLCKDIMFSPLKSTTLSSKFNPPSYRNTSDLLKKCLALYGKRDGIINILEYIHKREGMLDELKKLEDEDGVEQSLIKDKIYGIFEISKEIRGKIGHTSFIYSGTEYRDKLSSDHIHFQRSLAQKCKP